MATKSAVKRDNGTSYEFRVAVDLSTDNVVCLHRLWPGGNTSTASSCWSVKLLKELFLYNLSFSFITKACGERVTDKYIAEHTIRGQCQDRSFDIVDTFGLLQESLKQLAFTRGKCLPKMWRTPKTLQILHLTILQRVTGVWREHFYILQGDFPVMVL